MKIGDSSSWDSVFTDHLLATSVDRKTDINMQILNRGNCLKHCCSGKRQFVHHIEMQITKP